MTSPPPHPKIKTMNEIDLVLKYIEVSDLHLNRLNEALDHIKPLAPFKADTFPLKTHEDLSSLDMFTYRLSKLQDTMGSKLIPHFLKMCGENIDGLTLVDMLNLLQKIYILDDIKAWQKLRDIRNGLSHEYPESYQTISETLNEAINTYEYLSDILTKIKEKHAKQSSIR
jgi:hypothetical protein